MDKVALNDDLGSAVDVNAVGVVVIPLTGVGFSADVVNGVVADNAIAGAVVGRIGETPS